MNQTDGKYRRLIRVLIVAYLASWLAAMAVAVLATEYEVSPRIAEYSSQLFATASMVAIGLIWTSAIGLFFLAGWARHLFLISWVYSLAYSYIFGGGAGNQISNAVLTVHTMLAGAILLAAYSESSRSRRGTGSDNAPE